MNAIPRYPLISALLALAMLVVMVEVWRTPVPQIEWLPPQKTAARTLEKPPEIEPQPALGALARAWEKPVFSPGRIADTPIAAVATNNLDGMTLNGVVATPDVQVALLENPRHQIQRVHVGERLDNGWKLVSVERTQVIFESDQQRITLPLNRPHLENSMGGPKLPAAAVHIEH